MSSPLAPKGWARPFGKPALALRAEPQSSLRLIATRFDPARGEGLSISMTWPQFCRHECTFNGRRVGLSPKLACILLVLLVRRGDVISSGDMIEAIYPDPDNSPDWERSTVCQHITRLRDRLPGLVITFRKTGWMIPRPGQGRASFAPPTTYAEPPHNLSNEIPDTDRIDHCGWVDTLGRGER